MGAQLILSMENQHVKIINKKVFNLAFSIISMIFL